MISSTANVAMPAARPDSRINGSPTITAAIPPTSAASRSDGTLPTVVRSRNPKRPGMIAGFSPRGTDSTPAVHTPSATKLMWPNETTPELPMNTYSATTIDTLTRAVMKYTPVALETTLPSNAVAAMSRHGPARTEALVTAVPPLRVGRRAHPVARGGRGSRLRRRTTADTGSALSAGRRRAVRRRTRSRSRRASPGSGG